MAKGQILILPSGGATLVTTLSREEKPSFAILNPNDGVCYLKLNSLASLSSWDWKLPSQSFGAFPGPWESLGIFFLDQSGAGRQGEINLYDSDDKMGPVPDIHSIGRALQVQASALDITEGVKPANPGVGIARLWADVTDFLHVLNPAGIDATVIDSLTALGGGLAGTLPNPSIGAGSVNTAQLVGSAVDSSRLAAGAVSNAKIATGAGEWTTFTPAVNQGATTLTITNNYSWYRALGDIIIFESGLTIGSLGAAGGGVFEYSFSAGASISAYTADMFFQCGFMYKQAATGAVWIGGATGFGPQTLRFVLSGASSYFASVAPAQFQAASGDLLSVRGIWRH